MMRTWSRRAPEVANLFNPAFSALLATAAVRGYERENPAGMSFLLAFIALPLVFHSPTRSKLPQAISSKLGLWIENNSVLVLQFPERAADLVPICREAVLFGTQNHWVECSKEGLLTGGPKAPSSNKYLTDLSGDCTQSIKKAHFVGRWLAVSGDVNTIMSLFGVRP